MCRFLVHAVAFALLGAAPTLAQQSQQSQQDWFVPNQPKPPAAAASPPRPVRGATQPRPGEVPAPPGQQSAEAPSPPVQVALPPIPVVPPLPRGPAPPAAVIGVLGVPDVMRASTAAQQVEKIFAERREKLNQDAQKEQAAWRDMQQSLANDRAKLSPEQIRARERELQERITNAQRQFRERNRIIQEAAQYALGQIEQTLIAVIRQVADSRGMNLVLHRAQVALNANEFDITPQVVEALNKVQPSVIISPDGQEPPLAKTQANGAPPSAAPPSAAPPGGAQAPAAMGAPAGAEPKPAPMAQGKPAPAAGAANAHN